MKLAPMNIEELSAKASPIVCSIGRLLSVVRCSRICRQQCCRPQCCVTLAVPCAQEAQERSRPGEQPPWRQQETRRYAVNADKLAADQARRVAENDRAVRAAQRRR